MNRLDDTLQHAAKDLNGAGYRWALVGGFAVSARTLPRFTRDVDIAVMVASDAIAESLIHTLSLLGYTCFATVEHDNGRLATARLRRGGGGPAVTVDLLFASSGIEHEVVADAETLDVVSGLPLPVASVGHLIALKLLARNDESRPQDLADLLALASVATPEDWASAQEAVELITERGYNRGRDLVTALEKLKNGGRP